MRFFSVFSGAGGFELGLPADWECVGHSEIDKHASAVLRYHFPNVRNYGDITKIDWSTVPDFDLLVGGSPCQDLSVAGKRKGLAGGRSGLFTEYIRCLTEKKPEHFIWENVRGALSSNGGWDFSRMLNQMAEAGYATWWQVLNAKDFGVPQNRERIFVVGTRNGSPREVFFERGTDTENPQTVGEDVAYAIDANYHKGTNRIDKGRRSLVARDGRIRKLTPRECERLMSWPDDWTKYGNFDGQVKEVSDTQRYRMCGNGVVSSVIAAIASEHFR